jgi:hypothetical protein
MGWLVASLPSPESVNIVIQDTGSLEAALKSTDAEVVAVVSADIWPLPGWWHALTRRAQRTGCLVGGLLVAEDGRRVLADSGRASELGLCSSLTRAVRRVGRIPSRFALGRREQLLSALRPGDAFEAEGFTEPAALAIESAQQQAASGAVQ